MIIYENECKRINFSEVDSRFYLSKWDDVKKEWVSYREKHVCTFAEQWINEEDNDGTREG